MLDKLAEVANTLDKGGFYAEANAVTQVMKRVAYFGLPSYSEPSGNGPIEDFQPDGPENRMPTNDFSSGAQEEMSPTGGELTLDRIYAALQGMGIEEAHKLSPASAHKIFQAIQTGEMGSSQMAYAANSKFRRIK